MSIVMRLAWVMASLRSVAVPVRLRAPLLTMLPDWPLSVSAAISRLPSPACWMAPSRLSRVLAATVMSPPADRLPLALLSSRPSTLTLSAASPAARTAPPWLSRSPASTVVSPAAARVPPVLSRRSRTWTLVGAVPAAAILPCRLPSDCALRLSAPLPAMLPPLLFSAPAMVRSRLSLPRALRVPPAVLRLSAVMPTFFAWVVPPPRSALAAFTSSAPWLTMVPSAPVRSPVVMARAWVPACCTVPSRLSRDPDCRVMPPPAARVPLALLLSLPSTVTARADCSAASSVPPWFVSSPALTVVLPAAARVPSVLSRVLETVIRVASPPAAVTVPARLSRDLACSSSAPLVAMVPPWLSRPSRAVSAKGPLPLAVRLPLAVLRAPVSTSIDLA
ncbi:hypothetical protein D3C78_955110 [compost metagenome]